MKKQPSKANPPRQTNSKQASEQASMERLIISKMVLENFKSYAGERVIGPFHKCFTSVVGPNGSGKSNVIDALLFVFGKRTKQLRLNKVSELIHVSSSFPSLEYARVSIHFDYIIDEDIDMDPKLLEYKVRESIVISRTAFRDNTSKYTVNGKATSFSTIAKMLKDYSIDLDNNRFLILQGEVEQISMMKPKGSGPNDEGLLEYLEDIIGSNKFVDQIDEVK